MINPQLSFPTPSAFHCRQESWPTVLAVLTDRGYAFSEAHPWTPDTPYLVTNWHSWGWIVAFTGPENLLFRDELTDLAELIERARIGKRLRPLPAYRMEAFLSADKSVPPYRVDTTFMSSPYTEPRHHLPRSTPDIKVEMMSPEFTKYHLNMDGRQPWPFRPVIHHFNGPDRDGPHSHPWGFTTYIMAGGYVEEVYVVAPDGSWTMTLEHRLPGRVYTFNPDHIHRIVRLPHGECWTMVTYGPHEKDSRFYSFEEGKPARSRHWSSDIFELINSTT